MDEIEFYFRHRNQIAEWVSVEKRVNDLIRDCVREGDADKVAKLLSGDVGNAEIDFYVRNRSLLAEWSEISTAAGRTLHQALLTAARESGLEPSEGSSGWTAVRARSGELDRLAKKHRVFVELGWMRPHLMSSKGHGYPFPRLGLSISEDQWQGDRRTRLFNETQPVAHEIGMTRKNAGSWAHWCVLDAVPEGQNLRTYTEACVTELQAAAERLQPVLRAATAART